MRARDRKVRARDRKYLRQSTANLLLKDAGGAAAPPARTRKRVPALGPRPPITRARGGQERCQLMHSAFLHRAARLMTESRLTHVKQQTRLEQISHQSSTSRLETMYLEG